MNSVDEILVDLVIGRNDVTEAKAALLKLLESEAETLEDWKKIHKQPGGNYPRVVAAVPVDKLRELLK